MDRRVAISVIAGIAAWPRMAQAVMATPPPQRLRLVNLHTREKFEGPYRDESGPLTDAMADLSVFLRDFHSSATTGIDVAVIDFLAAIMDAVGVQSAAILSAYRTPETNARLARTTFGVAENSQHLYGRALDVYFETRLADAVRAARAMKRGGVGWYPRSRFLHIDSGPVRNWDIGETGLGSLLLDGRRVRSNGAVAEDHRYTAELKRSGRLQPGMDLTGRFRPEMEGTSRLRVEMRRSR
jgi:uncharacterized protein YcbK (DUF882 family)